MIARIFGPIVVENNLVAKFTRDMFLSIAISLTASQNSFSRDMLVLNPLMTTDRLAIRDVPSLDCRVPLRLLVVIDRGSSEAIIAKSPQAPD